MKQLPAIMRLITLAGLTALLLLAGAGCRESEPETAAPGATEAASAIAPTPTTETAETATPVPTATPISPTATLALPTATPESPTKTPTPSPTPTPEIELIELELTDLYSEELSKLNALLDENAKVGDVLEHLADEEVNCLQTGLNSAAFGSLVDLPALAFAASPRFLVTPCIKLNRKAEIAVAVMENAAGEMSYEDDHCVRFAISLSDATNDPQSGTGFIPKGCFEGSDNAMVVEELFAEIASMDIIIGEDEGTIGKIIGLHQGPVCLEMLFREVVDGRNSMTFEEFQDLPALALINIPISLADTPCSGEEEMSNITAAVVARYAGAAGSEVAACLRREFEESPTSERHPRLPELRLESAYFRCLTEDEYQNLVIAQVTAFAGELPEESASCAKDIAADGYNMAKNLGKDFREISPFFSRVSAFPDLFNFAAYALCFDPEQEERDCIRGLYDETLTRLRTEIKEVDWNIPESDALNDFWDDIEGCPSQS